MLLEMSPPLNAIHGYSSPTTARRRWNGPRILPRNSPVPRDLMSCLVGLSAVRLVQGHVTDAYELATRALDLAEVEPKMAGQAHYVVAAILDQSRPTRGST